LLPGSQPLEPFVAGSNAATKHHPDFHRERPGFQQIARRRKALYHVRRRHIRLKLYASTGAIGSLDMVKVKKVVAVVDDDESVCRAIKRLLKVAGIAVDMFPSGDSFLTMLSATPSYRSACVILDFEMPGINGLVVLRTIAPTGVPVIFTTAHDDPAVRKTALASGAVRSLQKPFDGAVLVKAVETALRGMPRP